MAPATIAFRGPLDRQLVGNAGQDTIAAGIAPQDQVAGRDVGVGDGSVLAHLGLAAELAAPFGDGVLLFGGHPGRDAGGQRRAGGRDEDEAIHEGVVDGALQAVDLVQAAHRGVIGERPLRAGLAEMRDPGTVAAGNGRRQLLTVDGDGRLTGRSSGTAAGSHIERERGDVGAW